MPGGTARQNPGTNATANAATATDRPASLPCRASIRRDCSVFGATAREKHPPQPPSLESCFHLREHGNCCFFLGFQGASVFCRQKNGESPGRSPESLDFLLKNRLHDGNSSQSVPLTAPVSPVLLPPVSRLHLGVAHVERMWNGRLVRSPTTPLDTARPRTRGNGQGVRSTDARHR